MFTVIESLGDSAVQMDGRTFPTPSLIEDEHGIRLLLLSEGVEEVPAWAWTAAHANGAAGLLMPVGAEWVWMLAETFIEQRTEHHQSASYRLPIAWSGPEDHPFTWREMREAEQTARAQERDWQAEGGTFVHLHTHSEFSPLDGLSKVTEIVEEVVKDGATAVAVTDHSVCAAHPHLQAACAKAGIKPIFGIEANFTDDRHRRGQEIETFEETGKRDAKGEPVTRKVVTSDAKEVLADYRHLVLWAMDDAGLRNLWAMSTEANRTGMYGRPRMDWEVLERWNEGVMASTACLRGPLASHLLAGDEEAARAVLARLLDIFGDRLYVEVHTNQLEEQKRLNVMLVDLAREYGLPLVAAVDSHYPCKDDALVHKAWIAAQTNKDVSDDADLFAGEQEYHLLTEAEVREALAYLGPQVVDEAVGNTVRVAERCTAVIEGKTASPVYSKQGGAQRDVERLVDLCMSNWHKTTGKHYSQDEAEQRFEREMRLLISKGFCGYFLMVADYCTWAREHGILVGPGRGSGGGSEVAYLSNIVDIDALDADLLFERFLTEGRVGLPDFDVDFPASKRGVMMDYVIGKYGAEYVVRVGTHIRLKNKGVVKDLARVLKTSIDIHWPDMDAVAAIIDAAEADKAGLGMSWADLWEEHGDLLAPYRAKYPDLFALADRMVGRLKSYGKHPAGVVISTDEPLTGRLPMRMADTGSGLMVAEFDMDALEMLGLVKFDFLTLRTLDTIQDTVDLIRTQRGVNVNVYAWKQEYADPQVWEEISDGHTAGIFQIETKSGTKLAKRFRPESLHQLADVITLVRPGPMRSGLTEMYFRRKAGEEPVTFPDERLAPVLAKTFGTLLYQEDIMQTTMVLAGYDSNEADAVRKVLGKKQVEKVAAAGDKFVRAAAEHGMDRGAADHLWEQMAEFAKYSFNRAHAFGYAVLGYWTAWLKFHYPAQFLTAVLSTVDQNRIPEFVNEARRMGFSVLPPDINESGEGFTALQTSVRYGLASVKGVGPAGVRAITAHQPYASFEDFLARKGSDADSGVVKKLAAVGAFDSMEPNRKALERRLEWSTNGEANRCTFRDDTKVPLPCGFDWATEKNPPLVKTKGQMVPKPPPKRCTKACRNFTAPVLDVASLLPYTDDEIMAREMELLGISLSATPFDRIPQEVLDNEVPGLPRIYDADEVEAGPPGEYTVAAVVRTARRHMARNDKEMAFLTLYAQTAELDVTVFSTEWATYQRDLRPNLLCFALIKKNDRGLTLSELQPL